MNESEEFSCFVGAFLRVIGEIAKLLSFGRLSGCIISY